ncbi:Putative oxidoreductase [Mycobacteroides abscessus]|nr:Putative oxidoreductase [Mycobacteroides abscessus]
MEHAARRIIAGLIAAAAALAVGQLAAAAVAPDSAPFYAVGNTVVDHTPAAVREWAIGIFGTSDKAVLFACLTVIIALLAALAGLVEGERRYGTVLIGLLGVFGAVAAVTRPAGTFAWIWPSVIAAVAGALVLGTLVHRAQSQAVPDRRRFFGTAAVFALGSAGLYWLGTRWSKGTVVAAERREATVPAPVAPAPPLPEGIDVKGAVPYITSNTDFYRIDTALRVPQVSTAEWQLNIHGMVDRPRTLTWADLNAMAATQRAVTLTCVSNEIGGNLIGNAVWTGFPIKPILESVGVHPDADMLLSKSVDGWTAGTPLQVLTDGRDAILAIAMNGTPLPVEHGYPVRQVVPGLYGYVSATKWVVDWEIPGSTRQTRTGPSEAGRHAALSKRVVASIHPEQAIGWARAPRSWPARPGHNIGGSPRSRCRSTTARGFRPDSRRNTQSTPGGNGGSPGRQPRVNTSSPHEPPTAPEQCRPIRSRPRYPMGRRGIRNDS